MIHRFAVNDWVRNTKTNEDGQVRNLYHHESVAMYEVSVPNDPTHTSWELGAVRADWRDPDVEPSNSSTLPV